ncbi:MAG TPA: dihydrolipoamide acetyltransferase family protein, partial [Gammaproteobacteria bacterium]|nr:dihydrolipoamide acetyltransferase family protein [Gammaproteobacteria bacterium]
LVEFDGESSDSESVVTQAATASVKEEASKLKEEINELIDELDSDDTFPKSKAEVSSGNDSGTVVGEMESSDEVVSDISTVGNVKIAPAVKALAKKLKVDLNDVVATGAGGVIRPSDIRLAHEQGSTAAKPTPAPVSVPKMSEPKTVTPAPARPQPPAPIQKVEVTGEWEQVKGTRRTMARIMADSHAQIVPTTIMDDADIYKWLPGEDITARLIRAIVAGVEAEPALNSWFDGEKLARRLISHVDIGIAVDTPDGLFVPTMRNCEKRDAAQVRQGMNTIKEQVKSRSIPPQDMKDFTIMLSNFRVFAGRYATPVITPPCVAIIAAGKLLQEVVPVLGGFEVHRMIPLSLTFDHRAVTGGEAARFLAAVIKDLNKSK